MKAQESQHINNSDTRVAPVAKLGADPSAREGGRTWVSSRLESVGETLTNMSVLAVPPRESDMSMVSLWLR